MDSTQRGSQIQGELLYKGRNQPLLLFFQESLSKVSPQAILCHLLANRFWYRLLLSHKGSLQIIYKFLFSGGSDSPIGYEPHFHAPFGGMVPIWPLLVMAIQGGKSPSNSLFLFAQIFCFTIEISVPYQI